jgi:hypothetical protein
MGKGCTSPARMKRVKIRGNLKSGREFDKLSLKWGFPLKEKEVLEDRTKDGKINTLEGTGPWTKAEEYLNVAALLFV